MKSELDKIHSRLVKARQKVKDIITEETAYFKKQIISCCMVFDKGTLFEKHCNGEMVVGDTILYQMREQWSLGYDEGSYEVGCKIKCIGCGNVLQLSETKDLDQLKPYFKETINIRKYEEI